MYCWEILFGPFILEYACKQACKQAGRTRTAIKEGVSFLLGAIHLSQASPVLFLVARQIESIDFISMESDLCSCLGNRVFFSILKSYIHEPFMS